MAGYSGRNWSTPMKLVSGLASAAAWVASVMRKPTVTITFGVALEGGVDVLLVVGLGGGLDEARLEAEALLRRVQALVGVLVERAVVDLADVGHEADGEAVGDLDPLVLGLLAERRRARAAHRRSGRRRRRCPPAPWWSVSSEPVSSSSPHAAVSSPRASSADAKRSDRLCKGASVWGLGNGRTVATWSAARRRGVRFVPIRSDYRLAGLGGARPDSAPMARILVTEKIADGGLDRLRAAGPRRRPPARPHP